MNELNQADKLWLAGRLPDLIDVNVFQDLKWKGNTMFPSDWERVTNREWHYIVALVEEKIPEELQTHYCTLLGEVIPNIIRYDFESHHIGDLMKRTQALQKVLGDL